MVMSGFKWASFERRLNPDLSKQACSFLKKRTKKLLAIWLALSGQAAA
jgi:hypothetical protein